MATTELGHIIVGDPDTSQATECPTCGFDSLLRFPLHVISASGVTPIGHVPACVRCYPHGDD